MTRGDLRADARLAHRNDGVAEARHVNALFEHAVCELLCDLRVVEHDRNDRMLAGKQIEAELFHFLAEIVRVRVDAVTELRGRFEKVDRLHRRGADRGREGALIDAEALVEGIKQRKVGAACLDVYEEESNVFFHDYSNHIVDDDTLARLISMPNVIVTSHQAFLTEEALTNIADTTLDNVKEFFANEYSKNEICYKCPDVANCMQEHGKKCF